MLNVKFSINGFYSFFISTSIAVVGLNIYDDKIMLKQNPSSCTYKMFYNFFIANFFSFFYFFFFLFHIYFNFTGVKSIEKVQAVREELQRLDAESHIVTALDDIACKIISMFFITCKLHPLPSSSSSSIQSSIIRYSSS